MSLMKRVGAFVALVYLVSIALVAYVPTAAAQTTALAISLDTSGANPEVIGSADYKATQRLKPEVTTAQVKFKFVVEVPAATACIVPITVIYTAKAEGTAASWAFPITSTGQQVQTYKSSQSAPTPGAAGEKMTGFEVIMTITTTRDAPAFAPGKYIVTAQAKTGGPPTSGCNFADSGVLSVPYTIINDYVARMVYEPSSYIQKTGQNKRVSFGLTMTNLGNGATKVDTVVDQTSKNKLDAVIPPVQQIVLSKSQSQQNKNTVETVITVQTPHSNGYTNTFYSMKATFTGTTDITSATDVTPDVKSLNLSVQVQGVYVPGFDPTMAIAALGVALMSFGLLRRRSA